MGALPSYQTGRARHAYEVESTCFLQNVHVHKMYIVNVVVSNWRQRKLQAKSLRFLAASTFAVLPLFQQTRRLMLRLGPHAVWGDQADEPSIPRSIDRP